MRICGLGVWGMRQRKWNVSGKGRTEGRKGERGESIIGGVWGGVRI